MLKDGIIGGSFGVIGLLPAFASIKNCKVVALSSRHGKQLVGFHSYADWRTMIEKENLDAIALAVPPKTQYEIVKVAIKKGLHVFAEKPFTANLAQAKELYALAKKNKIVHGIDFEFPEIAEWKKTKELLDRKTFGTLKHVSVDWDWQSGDTRYGRRSWKTSILEGGGALSAVFSHGIYYLEHFAGKITDVKSAFTFSPLSLNGGEVGVDMLLKFKGGVTGNVHVSCHSPGFVRHRLLFICERGVIVLENKNAIVDGFTIRTFDKNGEKILRVSKDTGRKNEDERVKVVKKLAKRFVKACIAKKQTAPSFADGVRVQELIETIRRKSRH